MLTKGLSFVIPTGYSSSAKALDDSNRSRESVKERKRIIIIGKHIALGDR
jgi:hypothetical protein